MLYNHFIMSAVSDQINRGVLSSAELRQRMGVSPATMMRALRQSGPDVVRIGRGRAIRYGLRQSWPSLETTRFPMFHISEDGIAHSAGEVFTLAGRQTVWMPAGAVTDGLPI